eukprot:TRINITY_DN1218_c0_g1_i2.p1 TRINITY_DN1218_c0_g1~~TRINITY_DN1218_c0_g1_i2.p1  ORF type:complete len:94 (-),score=33.38 TRINITY_DN1218_c0_g1_i2:136-417(-)
MKVIFQGNGEALSMNVSELSTVASVKENIHSQTGILPRYQKLKFNGSMLSEPEMSMRDYGVDGDIDLSVHLQGGCGESCGGCGCGESCYCTII